MKTSHFGFTPTLRATRSALSFKSPQTCDKKKLAPPSKQDYVPGAANAARDARRASPGATRGKSADRPHLDPSFAVGKT